MADIGKKFTAAPLKLNFYPHLQGNRIKALICTAACREQVRQINESQMNWRTSWAKLLVSI